MNIYRSDYDQPHMLTAVANIQLPNNLHICLKWRYTSGRPYTPVIGRIYHESESNSQNGFWLPVEGEKNSSRLPEYHRLDLRLEKVFSFSKFKLSPYIEVYNVYNRKNCSEVIWNENYTDQYETVQLPLLGAVGFSLER